MFRVDSEKTQRRKRASSSPPFFATAGDRGRGTHYKGSLQRTQGKVTGGKCREPQAGRIRKASPPGSKLRKEPNLQNDYP